MGVLTFDTSKFMISTDNIEKAFKYDMKKEKSHTAQLHIRSQNSPFCFVLTFNFNPLGAIMFHSGFP